MERPAHLRLLSLALLIVGVGLVLLFALGGRPAPPAYTITIEGGRPAPPGVNLDAVYPSGSQVRVRLLAVEGATERAAVRAWIKHGDHARPIGEALRADGPTGWILAVPADALFGRPGRYSLHFGLARDPAIIADLREAHPEVQWLSADVAWRAQQR